jgi:type VI secretion system secreted protein Hcp
VKTTRTVRVAAVAAIAAALVTLGVTAAVTAAATGSSTTYYACLKAGKLIEVGTTSPTCPGSAAPISWGAQGPAGPAGAPGAQGAVGQASVVNLSPALACPNPSPVTPNTPREAFLDIPSIPGESTDVAHPNQIDVYSWSLGVTGTGAGQGCASGGSASDQGASPQELTVIKLVDKATPPLALAVAEGTNLGTVTLSVIKSTSGEPGSDYLDYTFSHTLVKSISWSHDDESPKEAVTFQYTGLTVQYRSVNTDGSLGAPVVACFDFALHASC